MHLCDSIIENLANTCYIEKEIITSLLNIRCSFSVLKVLSSTDASLLADESIVIVDNILPPSASETTCLHPILKIVLPCFVRR